jgi:hypothetical protein
MAGLQVVRLAPGKGSRRRPVLEKIAASGRLEWRCWVGDSGAAEGVRPTFSILLQPRARSPHATRGKRHQGSTIFTHNDTMATELQVVMDPTVVGWETSFLLWRLETLHLPLSSSRRLIRHFGVLLRYRFWRCSTPGSKKPRQLFAPCHALVLPEGITPAPPPNYVLW